MFELDDHKLMAKEDRARSFTNIDKMIRKAQITPEMATSLMNDLSYSKAIIRDLTRAAKILFSDTNTELLQGQSVMELEDEDIRNLSQAGSAE